MHSYHKMILY